MNKRNWLRRAASLALALAVTAGSALAAGEEFIRVRDTVCGSPGYRVFDLAGDGEYPETFSYDVPEGGVAALIFFSSSCGRSQALFRGISVLTENPLVNVVPVTQDDRAAAQGFADTYIQGKIEHVYYNESAYQNPCDAYMNLLGGTGGTAFVVLVTESGGVKTIRWSGTDVRDAQAVKARVDALLGGTPEEPEEPAEPSGLIDTVAGQEPSARVARLWGGGSFEPFDYTVPEGGVTALVFFTYGCGNCANLLQGLSLLTEDPRVNVVAVSLEDAQRAAAAAGAYGLAGVVDEVYYAPYNNPAGFYARLLYDRASFGTALVVLAEEADGVKYIRWHGEGVRDARTVKDQVDALLGGTSRPEDLPASAVLSAENCGGGKASFAAGVSNQSGGALSGRLWAAGYAGGRQTDMTSPRALTLPAGGSCTESFAVRGEGARLFFLDGDLRPLMRPLEAGRP